MFSRFENVGIKKGLSKTSFLLLAKILDFERKTKSNLIISNFVAKK